MLHAKIWCKDRIEWKVNGQSCSKYIKDYTEIPNLR